MKRKEKRKEHKRTFPSPSEQNTRRQLDLFYSSHCLFQLTLTTPAPDFLSDILSIPYFLFPNSSFLFPRSLPSPPRACHLHRSFLFHFVFSFPHPSSSLLPSSSSPPSTASPSPPLSYPPPLSPCSFIYSFLSPSLCSSSRPPSVTLSHKPPPSLPLYLSLPLLFSQLNSARPFSVHFLFLLFLLCLFFPLFPLLISPTLSSFSFDSPPLYPTSLSYIPF